MWPVPTPHRLPAADASLPADASPPADAAGTAQCTPPERPPVSVPTMAACPARCLAAAALACMACMGLAGAQAGGRSLTALSNERLVFQTQYGDIHMAFYHEVRFVFFAKGQGEMLPRFRLAPRCRMPLWLHDPCGHAGCAQDRRAHQALWGAGAM